MRKLACLASTAVLACLMAGCANTPSTEATPSVPVMLEESGGFTVTGDNPLSVSPGEDAVFHVTLPEGYTCIQTSENAVWDEAASTLTVSAVRYPATASLTSAYEPKLHKFYAEPGSSGGKTKTSHQGFIYEGVVVDVQTTLEEGYRFDGWSLDLRLSDGGQLISASPSFRYTVSGSAVLYANYSKVDARSGIEIVTTKLKKDVPKTIFTYHANGGVYAETGKTVVPMEVGVYHDFQNCLPAKDYFVREGYQLIEYNTRPDGSGDAYSPGAKVLTVTEDPVMLYCIWAKESDPALFSVMEENGNLTVTNYTGDEETVVIPETIGGKAVTRIAAGAFSGKNFTTLVIPKTVTRVESKAFIDCGKMTTLYLFDTVQNIPNTAFSDISSFKNFRLLAAMDPRYPNTGEGGTVQKWSRLVKAKLEGKKVLAVFSGSSSMTGLDSPWLDEQLKGEYVVVNYGTRTSNCGIFHMETIAAFLSEGDIIVHAPELFQTMLGQDKFYWYTFRMIESNYNVLRYVDISHYSNYFQTLSEYNGYRMNAKALDYTYSAPLNEYGDGTNSMKDLNKETSYFNHNIILDPAKQVYGKNGENLNRTYQMMLDRGAKVYMSCAPCNINAINKAYKSDEAMAAYTAGIRERVVATVISQIKDYAIGGQYMRDHDYHINIPGRTLRTEQLYRDLVAQMQKDGIKVP